MRWVASLAVLAAVCWSSPAAAALDDAPLGVIPSSTTLAKVRALYERAHLAAHTKNATLIETWHLQQDGESGMFRDWHLGKDVREMTTLGPLVYENGIHNGTHWQQNRNGITFTFAGYHERDAIDERAWASHDERDVRLIGESVPANAYVVEVDPPRGRLEWLFIDKQNGQIVRRERMEKRRRYVTAFEDFKAFDGVLEPSHIRMTDSLGNEREQTIATRLLDSTPDPKDVEIPASRRSFVEFPNGISTVRLPVRIVNGLFVVRVGVDYHFYDFLLDSGAAGIVIDPSIVESLGLERLGARVGATLGPFAESTTIVQTMTVGPLHLHNVVTRVVAVPFRADERTRIAGLLGFDFFADTIVHVDTERGFVEAIAPAAFRTPAGMTTVPLALDDKEPAARARIGNVEARVILDTGANRTVLGAAFADRADLASERSLSIASRFRSVGGIGMAATVRVHTLDFGGSALHDPLVDISSAELGVEDVDGVLGTDLLRNYDIYFDYHANAAYVRRLKHGWFGS